MKKKEELCSFPQQENSAVAETDIRMVPIAELQDFEGHPFKVENDMALFELMQSIEKEGVIVPALARPKAGGGYELIAGHRRKAACKWAGLEVMPVVIRDLDDNQAVIAMVDSNLQREHLKPSEKAFAYKMKLEAMKRQGARTDFTSSQVGKKLSSSQTVTETSDQVGPKLENSTMKIFPLQSGHDENGNWLVRQEETVGNAINSNETLAKQMGESRMTIQRYIRLTNLIPEILEYVDEGRISFTPAVELSYLNEQEQYDLLEQMEINDCTPSLSQACRFKKISFEQGLTPEIIAEIMSEEKANQKEMFKVPMERIRKYIPKGNAKQTEDFVLKACEHYYKVLQRKKERSL